MPKKQKQPVVEEPSEESESQMMAEMEDSEMEMEEGEFDQDDQMQAPEAMEDLIEEEGEAEMEESNDEELENQEEELEANVDEGLETNIQSKRDEVINQMLLKEDLGVIQMRIKDTLKVLSNFKTLREDEKTRNDYLSELKQDIQNAYDYNAGLVDVLMNLFSPQEAVEYIEAQENQRPLVIRTNTLKAKRRDLAKVLIQRGV